MKRLRNVLIDSFAVAIALASLLVLPFVYLATLFVDVTGNGKPREPREPHPLDPQTPFER